MQGADLLPIFSTKAIALHDAVYGKCDSVDGLVDGIIDDPRKCNFDHLTDLPACRATLMPKGASPWPSGQP
jgi:feruloyl esterase